MKNFPKILLAFALLSCEVSKPLDPPDMPMAVSNNAVVGIQVDGKDYVYSFGGIGTGKTHVDITLRSFKYSVEESLWTEIASLPDTMGKIASAASVVKGKIYIIGGYYVFPDGHEKSSAKVHIYDPSTDQFLEDGADLPTPIDDHVQAVWQDSLIYVATGWSDSLNVNTVQVYTPGKHWHYATSLPDEANWKVFGSSGVIVDDDIYFLGGAGNREDGNFPIKSYLRIGHINPENPLDIEWEAAESDLARIYRPAAIEINGQPHWIGGSSKSYNYNGIAYTGEKVNPVTTARFFNSENGKMKLAEFQVPEAMDLRGIAELSNGDLMIVGGMTKGQIVSNKVHLINFNGSEE